MTLLSSQPRPSQPLGAAALEWFALGTRSRAWDRHIWTRNSRALQNNANAMVIVNAGERTKISCKKLFFWFLFFY